MLGTPGNGGWSGKEVMYFDRAALKESRVGFLLISLGVKFHSFPATTWKELSYKVWNLGLLFFTTGGDNTTASSPITVKVGQNDNFFQLSKGLGS